MSQSTVKTTITTHTVEQTQTPTVGAKTCTIKNRFNKVFQWSWNKGVVVNGGNVIGPFQVLRNIAVPPVAVNGVAPVLFVLGYAINDVLEVEYN